jgi:putative ABC transport system substrate-binding protein
MQDHLFRKYVFPALFMISLFISSHLLAAPVFAKEVLVLLSNDFVPYREALMGFKKNCSSPYKIYNIKGEPGNARKLVGSWSKRRTPVVVTIGTPALEAAIKFFPDIPILFSMAYAPPRDIATHGGFTGVFLDIPLEKYLVLVKTILPNTKRVGILMNPLYFSENVEDMRVASKLLDISIHIKKAGTLREALYGVEELSKKADVVILQPDPLFASNILFEYALRQSLTHDIPLIGISENQVKHGALLGRAVDYEFLGVQTALICNQLVKGVRTSALPIVGPSRYRTLYNLKTANALGIHIPSRYLDGKEKIF